MKVRRIEWTYHTSTQEGAGTDSPVDIEIFRDNQRIAKVWEEPGETGRLDRGEVATRGWTFESPDGPGVSVSGTALPYTEDFPEGVRGHLSVRFRIHSNDAWRIGTIESSVISGELQGIPGPIDSFRWVESREDYVFAGESILGTDNNEGVTTLTLNY